MGENKRKVWITCMFLLLGLGVYIYSSLHASVRQIEIKKETQSIESDGEVESQIEEETDMQETKPSVFPVYISGAISCPGVYQLDHAMYLYELIELAGGFTFDADQIHINMVYVVESAQSIWIPSAEYDMGVEDPKILLSEAFPWENCESQYSEEIQRVNINTAGVDELCSLPGIGTKTAEKIIDFRNKNGPFTSIEQIKDVPGIGAGKFKQFCDLIYV